MDEIVGLKNLTKNIKRNLKNRKDVLVFAFNATGKTRMSRQFDNSEELIQSICYNAIVEDYFSWDNEKMILFIAKNTWLLDLIKDEGLDGEIISIFENFTEDRIDPIINSETGEVRFQIINEKSEKEYIKISKGEETLFKWSVFYAALKNGLDILNEKPENRSTDEFNNLEYIVIDDPISSLDEFKIYTLSTQIIELMKFVHEKKIKVSFLISTHHTMFYNILYNTMNRRNKDRKRKSLFYVMRKENSTIYAKLLNEQGLLAYHIQSLLEIKKAFENNTVKKNHYNMFRSVLEKSSIFLGYSKWKDLFNKYKDKDVFSKVINMNSHERYVDIETEYITQEQINVFKGGFDYFIEKFNIKL